MARRRLLNDAAWERLLAPATDEREMVRHYTLGADDLAATIPDLKFAPAVHVNYGESVLRMKDGLPKTKDFPAELGGSGETLPE